MQNNIKITSVFEVEKYFPAIDIFKYFANDDGALLLDSGNNDNNHNDQHSRYSYIAIDPYRVITAKSGVNMVDNKPANGSIFEILRNFRRQEKIPTIAGLPPFQGGIAGLFSYDLGWQMEKLPEYQIDDMDFPDMSVGFYDLILAFDLKQKKSWIISTGFPILDQESRLIHANSRLAWFKSKLAKAKKYMRQSNKTPAPYVGINLNWRYSDDRAQYITKTDKVIEYIHAGDIFQANLSQRFNAELPINFDKYAFFCNLQKINPAPFSGYYKQDNMVIASSSPERFLKLNSDGNIEARPIKGTRERGIDIKSDKILAEQLINSEKDHAENIMIVDLLRNDLSKLAKPHSVDVPQICKLESFASVHHLVSVVTARLKDGFDAIDLIMAAFPGGSITGAPKIRAMEIIAELEKYRRGPYCGSLGFISCDGAMDLSILIRTVCFNVNRAYFHAGGGIVADSNAACEYDESLIKAKGIFAAFSGQGLANKS